MTESINGGSENFCLTVHFLLLLLHKETCGKLEAVLLERKMPHNLYFQEFMMLVLGLIVSHLPFRFSKRCRTPWSSVNSTTFKSLVGCAVSGSMFIIRPVEVDVHLVVTNSSILVFSSSYVCLKQMNLRFQFSCFFAWDNFK